MEITKRKLYFHQLLKTVVHFANVKDLKRALATLDQTTKDNFWSKPKSRVKWLIVVIQLPGAFVTHMSIQKELALSKRCKNDWEHLKVRRKIKILNKMKPTLLQMKKLRPRKKQKLAQIQKQKLKQKLNQMTKQTMKQLRLAKIKKMIPNQKRIMSKIRSLLLMIKKKKKAQLNLTNKQLQMTQQILLTPLWQ